MSWSSGSSMFIEFWPLVQKHLPDADERADFTADLLALFVRNDMDTWDIEDIHSEIRAAILKSGYEITEPDRYND